MMKCAHCNKLFVPKQVYCSTMCRVYAHRSNDNVTKKRNDNVTDDTNDSYDDVTVSTDDL